MIRVWSDSRHAGKLDRYREYGSVFAYDPEAAPERAVSVTMPVQMVSWNQAHGLLPIFEMNLPEGALREHLKLRFAKATGRFDDFDLLGIVGRTQIGRIRYSAWGQELNEDVPFQSIDAILRARRGGDLFDYLLETFAAHSGLSGVQPKVLIRGTESEAPSDGTVSFRGATHIVKLWDAQHAPDLAANEFFCLSAAKAAGLPVPHFELSNDGAALVVERFDIRDRIYLGFEDFCVLNGYGTARKYDGSIETRLFKRLREYGSGPELPRSLERLFRLVVLNCAVRNGDAHLKNFGILYHEVDGPAELAPVYDIITTSAYIKQDRMALTLEGSTNWPTRRKLTELGQMRADLSLSTVEEIIEETADAVAATAASLRNHFKQHDVHGVGQQMDDAWQSGLRESLGRSS